MSPLHGTSSRPNASSADPGQSQAQRLRPLTGLASQHDVEVDVARPVIGTLVRDDEGSCLCFRLEHISTELDDISAAVATDRLGEQQAGTSFLAAKPRPRSGASETI